MVDAATVDRGEPRGSIERHGDVIGFFHERLVAAMHERKLSAAENTEFYLVTLLSDALTASGGVGGPTLVELYAAARDASGRDRISTLRTLGDRALYLAGFFDDYLERRGLSRRYFAQMGERAYEAAFRLSERSEHAGDRARAPVFRELGARFEDFADVFVEVRESTSLRTSDSVLDLYRRFERTRSQALAARLRRHGVYPARGSTGGRTPRC